MVALEGRTWVPEKRARSPTSGVAQNSVAGFAFTNLGFGRDLAQPTLGSLTDPVCVLLVGSHFPFSPSSELCEAGSGLSILGRPQEDPLSSWPPAIAQHDRAGAPAENMTPAAAPPGHAARSPRLLPRDAHGGRCRSRRALLARCRARRFDDGPRARLAQRRALALVAGALLGHTQGGRQLRTVVHVTF